MSSLASEDRLLEREERAERLECELLLLLPVRAYAGRAGTAVVNARRQRNKASQRLAIFMFFIVITILFFDTYRKSRFFLFFLLYLLDAEAGEIVAWNSKIRK